MMKLNVRSQALEYLGNHQVLTLATTGAEGPWAAAVFYVNKEFSLYFLSAGHTRHALNISQNQRVAGTVQEDYNDWPAIKGIQLEGLVEQVQGAERELSILLYQDKYPFIKHADPQLQMNLAKINWYRLNPTKVYFIDNSKGLGHRDEIEV